MLTAEALVRKGYLPRELPPAFASDDLGAHVAGLEPPPGRPQWTECARHNLARVSGFRRPLKIPNPRSFVELARLVEELWPELESHVGRQSFAISRPVVTRTAERALRPRYRFGQQPRFRARTWAGRRYVLKTDISQFYSSIYTHSIAWALEGKGQAKARLGQREPATSGDRLDKAIRAGCGGQTVGVPIGPDTSFLVAELVLSAIDARLLRDVPNLSGFRYIDDYELAFRTRSEAEFGLVALEAALAEYELSINIAKTEISELPEPFDVTWTHEIAAFEVRAGSATQTGNDLLALFSRAAELAKEKPGALKYALLKSRGVDIPKSFWPVMQSLVWSAASSEPTTVPAALDLLLAKSHELSEPVNIDQASDVLDGLAVVNAAVHNSSEVVWVLWAAISLQAPLSAESASRVSEVEDNFAALLALQADELGLLPAGSLDRTKWQNLVAAEGALLGPDWLLAYEGVQKGWLDTDDDDIAADPFFSQLSDRGVRFFNPNVDRTPFTGPAGPLPGSQVPDDYA